MILAEIRASLQALAAELENARYDDTTAEQCHELGEAAHHVQEAARLVDRHALWLVRCGEVQS